MSKQQPAPPPPQVQYEGYRWLGSSWGRTGKPLPSKIGGLVMLTLAVGCFVFAIFDVTQDNTGRATGTTVVGVLCLIAGAFFLVDAHYAKRAATEQTPLDPSVGPQQLPQE